MTRIEPHIAADEVRDWIQRGTPFTVDGSRFVVAETCRFTGRAGTGTPGPRALDLLQQELGARVEFDDPLMSATGDSAVIPFRMASPRRDGFVRLTLDTEAQAVTSIDVHYVQGGESGLIEGWHDDDFDPPAELPDGLELVPFGDLKRVVKNWGVEHWLYRDGVSPFGFKVIEINAGQRTSLQYHEVKDEGYFILRGVARLHFAADAASDVHTVRFPAGVLALVQPGTVHRLEALTDVLLVESSTKDDGTDNIRISDDWGRGDGRIESEHR